MSSIATLVESARAGSGVARAELAEELYQQFRRMAGSLLQNERVDHTLQPTALANEGWMRLASSHNLDLASRTTVLAAAAVAMQRVLIDHARARDAQKRFGGKARVTLTDCEGAVPDTDADVEKLDRALSTLADLYPRQHQVVTMKYLAGLTVSQIAAALDVSERTIAKDWDFARAWLRKSLSESPGT